MRLTTDLFCPVFNAFADAKVESRHMKDGKTNVELHGIPDSIKDK